MLKPHFKDLLNHVLPLKFDNLSGEEPPEPVYQCDCVAPTVEEMLICCNDTKKAPDKNGIPAELYKKFIPEGHLAATFSKYITPKYCLKTRVTLSFS